MPEYRWREGGPKVAVDANTFGQFLEELTEKLGHGPSAEEIVEAARSRKSPIYAAFEWDEAKNAEAFLRVQARRLVGSLQIVRVETRAEETVSPRAFLVATQSGRRGYQPVDKIVSDREMRQEVMANAREELERYLKKYEGILRGFGSSAIPSLRDAMDKMRDEADRLQAEARRRTGANVRRPVDEEGVAAVV